MDIPVHIKQDERWKRLPPKQRTYAGKLVQPYRKGQLVDMDTWHTAGHTRCLLLGIDFNLFEQTNWNPAIANQKWHPNSKFHKTPEPGAPALLIAFKLLVIQRHGKAVHELVERTVDCKTDPRDWVESSYGLKIVAEP